MDDDEREYGSSDNEQEEQDEMMEDADEMDVDNDGEEDDNDNDNDEDEEDEAEAEAEADAEEAEGLGEAEADVEAEPDDDGNDSHTKAGDETNASADAATADEANATDAPPARPASTHASPAGATRFQLRPRPETITARLYDIVPTMAAPQATSINAISITPDLRYWMTGGSDGYIRKYDGIGTINGKQPLTVAQRHPFVDSVVKSGILMSYWENDEPAPPGARADEHVLSPVYSLAVHSDALWLLSGLESGGINLQSVRHDEGKKIHCLREGGHTNAVSALVLAPDEKSVLSGSWDKRILDWDLNTGAIIRGFHGSGGQISAIEVRPASAVPIPAEASRVDIPSETFTTNNHKPLANGNFMNGANGDINGFDTSQANGGDGGGQSTDSPEHESLFGSPAGSLFGDNDNTGGGGAFGGEDDDEFSRAMEMTLQDDSGHDGVHHNTDFSLGDTGSSAMISQAFDGADHETKTIGGDTAILDGSNGTAARDFAPDAPPPSDADHALPAAPPPDQAAHDESPVFDAPPNSSQNAPVTTQAAEPDSPSMVFSSTAPPAHFDPTQTSNTTFLSAAIDGTLRIWDRRVPDPVARINNRLGVPPWCQGACWSVDGNAIYVGRRNATVEEFSIHKARSNWQPERTLKFPGGSGPVSCMRPLPNGRHLVCASLDILRLYDLHDQPSLKKHGTVPFTIVPGPPRAGVISCLYMDPTAKIMISTAGTRGWDGSCTEVLIGYEIGVPSPATVANAG